MNKQLEIVKKTRKFLLELINDLTPEQLNQVPEGFNNNIAWNFGHLIVSQQAISYLRAGLPLFIEAKYVDMYKPGTKPEAMVDNIEIDRMKVLFLSSIDQLEEDYQNNLFANYTPWTNRYGIELSNIDEAISFLLFHEGLHLGYIMALKRVVG